MKIRDNLFVLVKSLTKSEKRYFRRFVQLHGLNNTSNYIMLFNILNKFTKYDEAKLKNAVKNYSISKQLNVTKTYLKKLILKSLRSYSVEKGVNLKLKSTIENIEILYNKGIYKDCMKLIIKVKKFAYDNEKYLSVLDLLGWEKLVIRQFGIQRQKDNAERILKEELEVIEEIKNIRILLFLYNKLNSIVLTSESLLKNEDIRLQVEDIINNKIFEKYSELKSVQSRKLYYHIKIVYYLSFYNYNNAYTNLNEFISFIEAKPKNIAGDAANYIVIILNLINVCFKLRHYKDSERNLNKLERIIRKYDKFLRSKYKVNYEIALITERIELNNCLCRYSLNIPLIKYAKGIIDKEGQSIDKIYVSLLYFKIAVYYFYTGQFELSLTWVNNLLNMNLKGFLPNHYISILMLEILLHFELQNIDKLDSSILSTHRYHDKSGKNVNYIKIFLSYINKLSKANDKNEMGFILTRFKSKITDLLKDPYEKDYIDYIDIIAWIDSKIRKVSLYDCRVGKIADEKKCKEVLAAE